MVDPGPGHLAELKQIIYPEVKTKPAESPVPPDAFTLISEQVIHFPVQLTAKDVIQDLLTMTPHLYRASSAGRDKASALQNLKLTVDIRLRTYRC